MAALKLGHPRNSECRRVHDEVLAARTAAAAAGWPAVPGHTAVPDFFAGRSVLLTGATGFLGRLVLEQVLRTCPDVHRVYVVLRPKRGVPVQERLRTAVADPVFDRLREERPGVLEDKVHALVGEISQPRLGLSEADVALVCGEVSVFLNVAASVRFTEPIKNAMLTNVRSAREAVELAKAMPNLKVLVHVSTAYTNTNQTNLEERVYPAQMDWRTMLRAAEEIPDPDTLTVLGPKLLDFQPNSYVFSKALAEQVVNEAVSQIPVIIVRPSIVIGTDRDPIPGWIDNLYGFSVFWVLGGKGILRVHLTEADRINNLIPGDVVAKTILLAAWAKGIGIQITSKNGYAGVDVVHSVSLHSMGVRLEEMTDLMELIRDTAPLPGAVRYPRCTVTTSKLKHALMHAWFHIAFAVVVDLLTRLVGQKPRLVDIYRRCIVGLAAVEYFYMRQFRFVGANQWRLQSLLLPRDTKDYCFLDFLTRKDSVESYAEWGRQTMQGLVKYCLHEEVDPVKNRAHLNRIWWIETAVLMTSLVIGLVFLGMYYF